MDGTNFWLIYIQDEQVSVSLISSVDHRYQILATGPKLSWDINSEETIIKATDESLSAAALNANLMEDQEPETAAFVVPPFWVSGDGKISTPKLKLVKDICKNLNLHPSGFLAEDESIVEEANQSDGFPASFILLHLSKNEFYLSLVYLGHIKERLRETFEGEFNSQIVESTLLKFNSEAALPPQIIIFGQADHQTLTTLKNFPWVGKKNIETFLHFPEIKLYSESDIINIFTKIISSQINPTVQSPLSVEDPVPSPTIEELSLEETDAESLGFSSGDDNIFDQLPPVDSTPEPFLDPFVPEQLPPPPVVKNLPKINFNFSFLKKFKLPKIKFHNAGWVILIILPFLLFIPLIFAKSQITIFVTPYQFNKSVPVTLKVDGDVLSSSVVPVQKQSFDVKATATIPTTGQKTVGDKSKGEIVIYNKVGQVQNLPKGAILTDSSGKKFELTTAVSIASSSSNLDQGVITLGQTKTVIIATDIGSEFNINKDSQLKFKDFSDTLVVAKADSNFTGGSKQQIAAVSDKDKTDVQTKINQEVDKNIEAKINTDLKDIAGIIKETIQSKKNPLDLNREVGEQADELTGTITASVTVFSLSPEVKTQVINQFLSSEANFSEVKVDQTNFNLTFKVTQIDANKAVGTLTITGQSNPKIDSAKLQKNLTFKTNTSAESYIKKTIPRAYNFHINNNFPFGLLPFKKENISIEVKSESL
jgi:hypothetical protein